jgi:hypothetical protein
MSDATIKLPGVGPVKTPVALAAGGVVVGILIYAYWRRSKTNATDTTTATTDASTAIDPSTGLTYAEEAAGGGGTGYGYPSYGGYSGGGQYSQNGYDVYGNPLPAPTGLGGGAITTNNDWATQAETVLQGAGVTQAVATAAVTRVLGGLTVTSTQRDYFLQAVGTLGQPPQGYPTPIKVTDPGTGGPIGGAQLRAPSGLHSTGHSKHTVSLAWKPVAGAIGYRVYRTDSSHNIGESSGASITVGALSPNHTYTFYVRSLGADGKVSAAASAHVRVHTTK